MPALLPGLAAPPVNRSRISAITDEIARSPQGAIEFLKQYGLQLAELREVPGGGAYENLSEDRLREAARELREAGIRVSFLDAGSMKYHLPGTEPARPRAESEEARARRLQREGAEFERRMEHIRKAIRAAQILGTDKVRVFAFGRVAEPMKLMPRIAEILAPMVDLAASEKIHLLVENEASCNVATARELAELVRLLPSPWFGINWDIGNGMPHGEIPFPDGYTEIHNLDHALLCDQDVRGLDVTVRDAALMSRAQPFSHLHGNLQCLCRGQRPGCPLQPCGRLSPS